MPPEISALLDKPWLLAILLALGAGLGIAVERFVEGQKRAERRAYWAGRKKDKKKQERSSTVDLAADQLRIVMRAKFNRRALLNKPEAKVFDALDKAVIAIILAPELRPMRSGLL
ncbi:hypothetical protein [Altererythrobacter sp. GH1-8]|uniref:hypothetical protein n=1 Tax=Altererythrobacter sp. GH1-8 TaxID=3349333 RepID=UPI00374C8D1B